MRSMERMTGKEFYEGLDLSEARSFESLSDEDRLLFNLIAETAEAVFAEREDRRESET